MRRFAVKNLLLQLFCGYPKNGHKMTGVKGSSSLETFINQTQDVAPMLAESWATV